MAASRLRKYTGSRTTLQLPDHEQPVLLSYCLTVLLSYCLTVLLSFSYPQAETKCKSLPADTFRHILCKCPARIS